MVADRTGSGKHWIIIAGIALLFLLRMIFFAVSYGGVEHDSGWYLGVAKNLALRGIYASYTNTIWEEGKGAFPSIHSRFSVQDENGYVYYPAGVTVGPGYIVPEALIIKLFGSGFWQYRAWPLMAYAALVFLALAIVWHLGGWAGAALFGLWLWVVPQLSVPFAYEAFGEHIALLYALVSFTLLHLAFRPKRRMMLIFCSGIFFSLVVLTKNLFALLGAAFLLYAVWDFLYSRNAIRAWLLRWVSFGFGAFLPFGMFEVYRKVSLIRQFGSTGVEAVAKDFSLHFQSNGSSIDVRHLDWQFVAKKLTTWQEVGLSGSFWPWVLLIGACTTIFLLRQRGKQGVFFLLYASVAVSFGWFLFLSPTGWARHAWQGIILGMMVLSVWVGTLFTRIKRQGKVLLAVLLVVFCAYNVLPRKFTAAFRIPPSVIAQWNGARYERGLQGLPTNALFPLGDQEGLIVFFKANVSVNDRVYYAGWFLMAEASPLVDKVFYTFDRYATLGQTNPDGGRSLVIFGPFQQGPLSLMGPSYLQKKIATWCGTKLYQNPSYLLCDIRPNLPAEALANTPYE